MMPSDTNKSASGVRKPIALLPNRVNMSAYLTAHGSPVDPPVQPLHNCTKRRKRRYKACSKHKTSRVSLVLLKIDPIQEIFPASIWQDCRLVGPWHVDAVDRARTGPIGLGQRNTKANNLFRFSERFSVGHGDLGLSARGSHQGRWRSPLDLGRFLSHARD